MKIEKMLGIIWMIEVLLPVLYFIFFLVALAAEQYLLFGLVGILMFGVMLVYLPMKLYFASKLINKGDNK